LKTVRYSIFAFLILALFCSLKSQAQIIDALYIKKKRFLHDDSRLTERIRSRIELALWLWPKSGITNLDSVSDYSKCDSVRVLGIAGKEKLPRILSKFVNVDSLIFLDVSINRIPRRLRKLKHLRSLTIFYNRTRTRIRINKNVSIRNLTIVYTQPVVLPRSYRNLRALEHLSLTDNRITDFPNGIRKNKYLKEVNLQRNWITLAKTIKANPYIEKLTLHENKIVKVPESIRNLSSLKSLTLNRNNIEEVADGFSQLSSIERLSVYHNRLNHVPESFYRLYLLKELEFVYNEIQGTSSSIRNWRSLETLNLSHNRIAVMPESIGSLRNLKQLDLSQNVLVSLPDSLGRLTALEFLFVNNNRLTHLPLSFRDLSSLTNLDISKNELIIFPFRLSDLPELKHFSFDYNKFDNESKSRISEFVNRVNR
jgi:Leucine-rich repeat (LRR) protein